MTYKELSVSCFDTFKLWNSDERKLHHLGNLLFSFVLPPTSTMIQYFPLEWAVMETQRERERDNRVMWPLQASIGKRETLSAIFWRASLWDAFISLKGQHTFSQAECAECFNILWFSLDWLARYQL